MRMKKDTVATKYKIKTTYLSHSYYNKEIIGNESNHMIKKTFSSIQKYQVPSNSWGNSNIKNRKLLPKCYQRGGDAVKLTAKRIIKE